MRLLGESNWYLPKWLRWLPELHGEGHLDFREAPGALEPKEAPATV